MDEIRLDLLAEPMRCAHGDEFVVLEDGQVMWTPTICRACEPKTVSIPEQVGAAA